MTDDLAQHREEGLLGRPVFPVSLTLGKQSQEGERLATVSSSQVPHPAPVKGHSQLFPLADTFIAHGREAATLLCVLISIVQLVMVLKSKH